MSHLITPRNKKRVLTESNADSYTKVSPYAQTPTSHKKASNYEDIIYISKSELEKEVKAFIALLATRNSIKESEMSSYLEYLKKGIMNIALDSSQIENIENFCDVTRSPGHKRTSSSSHASDHHLKLRNFQLERDRIAYEDKLMNHGKYIADLEEKISKLIEEYKEISDKKNSLEAEVENLNKQLSISKNLNSALKTNNEAIMKKNTSLRAEVDGLVKTVAELEKTAMNESARIDNTELQVKISALEEQLRNKEEDIRAKTSSLEEKIREIESQSKKEVEEKARRVSILEETVKKDAGLKRRNETLQKQIGELEEQIKLDAGLKMKVAAFQQQISVLEEHIKRDVGLRVENESQQKKILELEEYIKNTCGEKKEPESRRENSILDDQSKKTADWIREIKLLKGQINDLKEQAKKDARLRTEFLDMQKLISELEERMKASTNQKKEMEFLQRRVVELEAQTKKDSDLKKNLEIYQQKAIELDEMVKRNADLVETVKFLQGRIFELEGQMENERLDRYTKVLEDMERVQRENEKLADQLTEREGDVKMLESQKEKLLKEIGGLIDNIRKENEEEEQDQEGNQELVFKNKCLTKEIREKDVIIQLLRVEAEKFMQEAQDCKRLLKTSEAEEIVRNRNQESEQPAQNNQKGASLNDKMDQLSIIKVNQPQITVNSNSILLMENFESQGTDRIQESYEGILQRGDLLQGEDISQLYGNLTYDYMKRQVEDFRTANVLLQKKVENYYLQIEELNSVLKITNENLDAAQNRCITLQRELQNKCNLEVLVQSLLNLINNLELKIEQLVDENISLQKVSQDNIITITNLRNQFQEEAKGSDELTQQKGFSNLEKETLVREYEEKIKRMLGEKELEFEEEQIRNKNLIDRYDAHLEVLGRKVQALVSVNEGLGRDLEVSKGELSDYKIVVTSILQETSKSIESLKNYDSEMQSIIQDIVDEYSRNTDVIRLREFYGMLKRDITEAIKQLEERKLLI